MQVIFKDWTPGLKKVSLTMMLQREAGLSLRDAKRCTDRLLEGDEVAISVSDAAQAHRLAAEAAELGVVAEEHGPGARAASG